MLKYRCTHYFILTSLLLGSAGIGVAQSKSPSKLATPEKNDGNGHVSATKDTARQEPMGGPNRNSPEAPSRIAQLRTALKMATDQATSAGWRSDDYRNAAIDVETISKERETIKAPESAMRAYSTGFSRLRDALLVQSAALQKEIPERTSLTQKLLLEDEVARLKTSANELTQQVAEISQIRYEIVASFTELNQRQSSLPAIVQKLQGLRSSSEKDRSKWERVRAKIQADLESEVELERQRQDAIRGGLQPPAPTDRNAMISANAGPSSTVAGSGAYENPKSSDNTLDPGILGMWAGAMPTQTTPVSLTIDLSNGKYSGHLIVPFSKSTCEIKLFEESRTRNLLKLVGYRYYARSSTSAMDGSGRAEVQVELASDRTLNIKILNKLSADFCSASGFPTVFPSLNKAIGPVQRR